MTTAPVEQADLPPYRHRGPCPRCGGNGPIRVHFDRDCTEARGDHFHRVCPCGHRWDHGPSRGCRFCLAAAVGETVVAVAIAGRPVARRLDDGWTIEVTRLATDGTKNACSFLYSACRRVAQAMGYRRVITYALDTEGGYSLRAAGWSQTFEASGGSWSRSSRPRIDTHPLQGKLRWEAPA